MSESTVSLLRCVQEEPNCSIDAQIFNHFKCLLWLKANWESAKVPFFFELFPLRCSGGRLSRNSCEGGQDPGIWKRCEWQLPDDNSNLFLSSPPPNSHFVDPLHISLFSSFLQEKGDIWVLKEAPKWWLRVFGCFTPVHCCEAPKTALLVLIVFFISEYVFKLPARENVKSNWLHFRCGDRRYEREVDHPDQLRAGQLRRRQRGRRHRPACQASGEGEHRLFLGKILNFNKNCQFCVS